MYTDEREILNCTHNCTYICYYLWLYFLGGRNVNKKYSSSFQGTPIFNRSDITRFLAALHDRAHTRHASGGQHARTCATRQGDPWQDAAVTASR